MERRPKIFHTTHQANFSVVDAFAHMGTVQYASFFIEHRWIGLRGIGLDLATVNGLPVYFATKSMNINFERPIRCDEAFSITSRVVEWRESDCLTHCEMNKADGKLAASCELIIVCVSKATNRATPWTSDVLDRFFEESP